MSNAIKMKGAKDSKKPAPKISQSIPASFYAKYIPPEAPRMKPKAAPANIPDLGTLPGVSLKHTGINIGKTGSYSLRANKHPMSMPVKGLMGPTAGFGKLAQKKTEKPIDENKEETDVPNSLEQKNKGLTVGSFTCFDVMNSPLKQLPESAPDTKDNASATSASTFASNKFDDEVAPDDNDDEEEDDAEGGNFELEL